MERTVLTRKEKLFTIILNTGLVFIFLSGLCFASPFVPKLMPGFDVWLSELYNRQITFDVDIRVSLSLLITGLLMSALTLFATWNDYHDESSDPLSTRNKQAH